MTDETDKLAEDIEKALGRQATEVEINGEVLPVSPLKAGQLAKALRAAKPLFAYLQTREQKHISVTVDLIVELLSEASDGLFDILAVMAGKPRAWVEDQDPFDLAELAIVLFGVNRDFFTRQAATRLPKLTTMIRGTLSSPETPPSVGQGTEPAA